MLAALVRMEAKAESRSMVPFRLVEAHTEQRQPRERGPFDGIAARRAGLRFVGRPVVGSIRITVVVNVLDIQLGRPVKPLVRIPRQSSLASPSTRERLGRHAFPAVTDAAD